MCLSSSPVQSVIFLILSFCCAAIILFMFHVEFIGLIFIIIYVGAIAVLFLFVIMMLNVKNQDVKENNESYSFDTVISSILLGACFIPSFFIYKYIYYLQYGSYKDKFFLIFLETESNSEFVFLIDELLNIEIIGQVLFNYYIVCVLLAGIILLIALVGSIVLTLKFNNSEKSQIANRQLARNDNFITFFK